MQKISNNSSQTFTHSGNSFSRAFFAYSNYSEVKQLFVFDNEKELKSFGKILSFVTNKSIRTIDSLVTVLDFIESTEGYFLTTKEIFTLPLRLDYHRKKYTVNLNRNDQIVPERLIEQLVDGGYSYSAHLAKSGSHKREGDNLSIRPIGHDEVIMISFFDTEIDEILRLDLSGNLLGKSERVNIVLPGALKPFHDTWEGKMPETPEICDYLGTSRVLFIGLDFFEERNDIAASIRNCVIFSENPEPNGIDLNVVEPKIETLTDLESLVRSHGEDVHFFTKHTKAIHNFLEYNGISAGSVIETRETGLQSFCMPRISEQKAEGRRQKGNISDYWFESYSWYFIVDDILGKIFIRNRTRKTVSKNLDLMLEIRPGDYIVHRDHWVGIFREIIKKNLGGNEREYMSIEYRENDMLFVPLAEIHRVSKYIGDESPKLTRLSTNEWKKTVEKANEDVEKIARELLDIYARRQVARGYPFPAFPDLERKFREAFQYKHTPDQKTAIEEIFEDMERSEPMDRLLSGDVGFGKTEVAMNALYKAVLAGKQVAFISPLVVLAYEHSESLAKRFSGLEVNIATLTRLTTDREAKQILSGLRDGTIHAVVGTHRILGEGVQFKDLGLLIIDEEHRFGVLDKEKINAMKSGLDILSLSATPIPRSLNLALSGIKKISVLTTPPPLKKRVDTIVSKWSEPLILEAVKRELDRGGQVIFLHNRVASIESLKKQLIGLLGKAIRIGITHGRMNGIELEDTIMDFKLGKFDILLSTTVIENGVNFLNANTIFIDDAERFGLAQLHQLRGRVGRKDREAFCYLLYHRENLDDDAKKRLLTIVNHSELGAGFEIALRDLEIRGAGDILGIKQSGKTNDTGLSLYLKLLEEKIEELQSGQQKSTQDCKIELDISYSIPDDFFDSELDKIRFFRSIESIETRDELDYAYETFQSSNDSLPETFENLFLLLRVRIVLKSYGIIVLKRVGTNYIFEFEAATPVEMIRRFLDIDRGGHCIIVTMQKIKTPTNAYRSDRAFLEGLLV